MKKIMVLLLSHPHHRHPLTPVADQKRVTMRHASVFLTLLFVLLSIQPVSIRTWYVSFDGLGDAPTIQAAIDSTTDGDSVLVAPGNYTWANQGGDFDFGMIHIPRGKNNFVLVSEAGPEFTTIDAQGNSRVMFIAGFNYITVEGFTITGGDAPSFGDHTGGGIAAHLTHDTIRNCIFKNNRASFGGGLWCGGVSSMQIIDCEFSGNQADYGGGLFFINSSLLPSIEQCRIYNNVANIRGGGIYAANNGFSISSSILYGNESGGEAGAIYLRSPYASSITSSTITANESVLGGSGIFMLATPILTVDRSIISHGSGVLPFEIATDSAINMSCSDIYGNQGGDLLPVGVVDLGGNFTADPLFCGAGVSGVTISGSSPCADGSHPDGAACGLIGALGPSCGNVAVQQRTWGAIKASYRE
jgi:hypothetical protein